MVTAVTSLLRSETSGCRFAVPSMASLRHASAFLFDLFALHLNPCLAGIAARIASPSNPPMSVECQSGTPLHQPQPALTTPGSRNEA